jgi:alkylresorcinol/alkylpyrone synthase
MGISLVSLGTAVPPRSLDQRTSAQWSREVLANVGKRGRLIDAIYARTGIAKRYSVILDGADGEPVRQEFFRPATDADDRGPTTRERMVRYEKEALPLALEACRAALDKTTIGTDRAITHVVTASCSGFQAPGVDIGLIRGLGLPPDVQRTNVGFMGCHGAFNALRVARAFVEADSAARVLVCAVELCTLHYQYGLDAESLVANGLFADGAGAVVVAADAESPDGSADGDDWILAASGSVLLPETEDLMSWEVGDHGFVMGLSGLVPGAIGEHLRPWLEGLLGGHGLAIADVPTWAIHPGGPRILTAVENTLDLSDWQLGDSRAVLRDYGNMSSPTILFILERLRERKADLPCVALGFGPGLTAEAMLIR